MSPFRRADPDRGGNASRHHDDPWNRHRQRRAGARPGQQRDRSHSGPGSEKRPFERVEAQNTPRRVVHPGPRPVQGPEVHCEAARRRAEHIGAEADCDDAARSRAAGSAAVHAGDLAVPEDVAGVGEEQTGEANWEPRLVGLPKRLENLIEVCDLTDQRHRTDDQEQRNRHTAMALRLSMPSISLRALTG
jgi:hypothetical protein